MDDFDRMLDGIGDKPKESTVEELARQVSDHMAEVASQFDQEAHKEAVTKEVQDNIEEQRLFQHWQDSVLGRAESDIPLSDVYWERRETHRKFVNSRKG